MTAPPRYPWQPRYHADEQVLLHLGESLAMLRAGATLGYDYDLGYEPDRLFPDASVDAVITDPPYGIGFMGHQWDQPGAHGPLSSKHGGSNVSSANARFGDWCEAWARECLRVLKPGGHILAFGGARTWHRLQTAVEDAGFEIRDSIAWLYGSGFPKSLDVSKAIDAAAGAVRVDGQAVRDRVAHLRNERYASGPAGFSRERGTTLAAAAEPPVTDDAQRWAGWGTALKPGFEPIVVGRKPLSGTVAANVLAHGTGALNIDGCRVSSAEPKRVLTRNTALGLLNDDAWEAQRQTYTSNDGGRWPTNVVLDTSAAAELDEQTGVLISGVLAAHHARAPKDAGILGAFGAVDGERGYGDSGGASRFFPTFVYEAKAPALERPRLADGTAHPTVKPLDLMRWCVRLVTPPGGLVLDLFNGSGTTAEACVIEGMRYVGIEREEAYLRLTIDSRLAKPIQRDMFGAVS